MRNLTGLVLASWLIVGCASQPVNTDNPSTSDLLFRRDQLDRHLDSKRIELGTVQGELNATSSTLSQVLADVGEEKEEIAKLERSGRASEAELVALRDELSALENQSIEARRRMSKLQSEKGRLDAQSLSSSQTREADAMEAAVLKAEILQLQKEIAVYERGIQRVHETTQRFLLRAD